MSGPKSSRYQLTAEQLKRLLEEQERLRKKLEEKVRKEREGKEVRIYLASIKAKVAKHREMIFANEQKLPVGMNGHLELQEQYRTIYSLIKQVETLCNIKLNATHDALMSAKKEAGRIFDEIVLLEGAVINETSKVLLEQKMQEDSIIAEGMTVSFENVGIVKKKEDPIFAETKQSLEQLLYMELSEDLLSEVNCAIKQAKKIENVSVMQNFSSITVVPLSKKCRAFVSFAKKNKAQYEAMLDKYGALCKQMGIQAKQIAA